MYRSKIQTNSGIKTIALVDPFIGGHHLIYMQYFSKTLLDLNHRVVVFFPQPNKIYNWLQGNCSSNIDNLILVSFQDTFKSKHQNKFFRILETMNITINRWLQLRDVIKQTEKKFNIQLDFLFIAWLDSYLFKFTSPFISVWFKYSWSGLYFHPSIRLKHSFKFKFLQNDSIINSATCKGVAILDRNIVHRTSKRFPGKQVFIFPDISDDHKIDIYFEPVRHIKESANDRTIVGLIGLQKRKGTLTMIRIAKAAPITSYFFVFCGQTDRDYYSDDEWAELTDFFDRLPENCYFYKDYVSEEKYNSFVDCFNILFAVYLNFHSSSNVLTKAAMLNRPVLSTNKFYMGEIVKEFNLGVVVEEDDIISCLEGLNKLREMLINGNFDFSLFSVYKELNAPDILKSEFLKMLEN